MSISFAAEEVNPFKKSSYFCCYISLVYFWRPTGRQARTKRKFTKNAVVAARLSVFNTHRGQMPPPET